MEVRELTDRLETVQTHEEARDLLADHRRAPGLSRQYLSRTLDLFSRDRGGLGRLGRWAKLVVQYGDDRAASYRALGIAEHAQGRFPQSAAAFLKAGEHAVDRRESLRFQMGAVDALGRAGRTDEAVALADRLQRGLNSIGERALAAGVRVNLANALIAQDRYREAFRLLTNTIDQFEAEGMLPEVMSARLALSTCHLFGGNPEQARVEAETLHLLATENGYDHFIRYARLNSAYVALVRGRGDEALSTFVAIRDEVTDTPGERVRVLEYLGDAFARLNLWPEAIDAYRSALEIADYAMPLHRGHIALGLGQALLANGDVAEAARELRDAANRYRKVGNRAWCAAATAAEAEILHSVGKRSAAKKAQEAAVLARESQSPYQLSRALLVAAQCCSDQDALNEAGRLVKKHEYGGLEWRLHATRARLEPNRALAHYRRMFDAILHERAFATSMASRASYLRDKGEALREYLDKLLETPNSRNIQEAISVIERSRSVALLDEIVSARSDQFSDAVRDELQALRREMEGTLASDPTGDGSRALVEGPVDLGGFQRRWLERTHRLITSVDHPITRRSDTASFVSTRNAVHVLSDGAAWRLKISPEALAEQLKWLQYELLEPMLNRNAPEAKALAALEQMAESVLLPWARESQVTGITPDGLLWRVPWTACCGVAGLHPLELRLHPGLGGAPCPVPQNPMTALWIADHTDLRHASKEAEAFLEMFPRTVIARTAQEARAMLGGRFDILHVVAHAKHRWSNPMFSSIEFPDGSVFASEVAQSSLNVSFVMLSACDTGAMSLTCQDEPDGFARAFLGRGAKSVIGSAWPLDDEAATRLSYALYRAMLSGTDVLTALKTAQEETRAWKAHPYFWASHLLYGGYQA